MSNYTKFAIWDDDNNKFTLLLVITFVLVYFSPSVVLTRISFLFFLPLIFNSKKDYIWMAWLFIIVDAPGYLFQGGRLSDLHRIPLYPLFSSVSIDFYDLVLATYILKLTVKKRYHIKRPFVFQSEFFIFFTLIIIYVVYSLIGYSSNLISIYKLLMPWGFAIIVFFVLRTENDFHFFNKIIFPLAFILLYLQLHSLIAGEQFVNLFKETHQIKGHLSKDISELSDRSFRMLSAVFLTLYIIIVSLFYLSHADKKFPKKYLLLILVISVFNAFITGTRGYLLSAVFIFVMSYFFVLKQNKVANAFAILGILIFFILLLPRISPKFETQLKNVTERYETLILLAQGDATAGGSLRRLDVRGPRVMKKAKESPVFGHGFSNPYFEFAEGDVGFHSMVLNSGWFGTIVQYLLIISILVKIYRKSKLNFFRYKYSNGGLVFLFGFLGILLFHHTTNMAFGMTPGSQYALHERYIIYGLLLVFFNNIYLQARNYHKPN
jgi:hypothetical protein